MGKLQLVPTFSIFRPCRIVPSLASLSSVPSWHPENMPARCVLPLLLVLSLFAQPESDILAAHNRVRAKLGLPPLEWSKEAAAVAQQWADQLAANGKFEHRP